MRQKLVTLIAWSFIACETAPVGEVRATATLRAPATFRASCHVPSLAVCREYTDEVMGLGESLARRGCLDEGGTWSPARCPAEGRLGLCTARGGARAYYPGGGPGFTTLTAARDCVELYEGSFVAN